MRLNHKFKLVPITESDEASNITSLKARMEEVLKEKNVSDNEKISIFADLLARLRNYNSELDSPPSFQIHTPPRSDIVPQLPVRSTRLDKIVKTVRGNDANEMVLDGRTIPGTNINDIINYALKRDGAHYPAGYEEFYNSTKHITGLQKPKTEPVIEVPTRQSPPPSTSNTRTSAPSPVVMRKPPGKVDSPKSTTLDKKYPHGLPDGIANSVKGTPRIRRPNTKLQFGDGRRKKRLNIRLWKDF